jgi:hypothetical protein
VWALEGECRRVERLEVSWTLNAHEVKFTSIH